MKEISKIEKKNWFMLYIDGVRFLRDFPEAGGQSNFFSSLESFTSSDPRLNPTQSFYPPSVVVHIYGTYMGPDAPRRGRDTTKRDDVDQKVFSTHPKLIQFKRMIINLLLDASLEGFIRPGGGKRATDQTSGTNLHHWTKSRCEKNSKSLSYFFITFSSRLCHWDFSLSHCKKETLVILFRKCPSWLQRNTLSGWKG